jgi:hypothetical protein
LRSNIRRQFKLALHQILLTLVRKSELILARWEQVDFETAEWQIPAENSKTKAPHTVYLSRQSVQLFRELQELACGSAWVIPSRSSLLRPFSKAALNRALEGVSFGIQPFTIHDMRRTGSTLLHEKGFSSDVIEKALNPVGLVTADFNGDGSPDLVASNYGGQNSTVLLLQPTLSTESATATMTGISIAGPGAHATRAIYLGDVNYQSSISATTNLTAHPVATTITLGASPTSSTYGQQVVLTATLSPYTAGGVSSDGETVTLYHGGTNLGSGVLASGVATIDVTALAAGTAFLMASYGGDTNLVASTSTGLS